MSRAGGKAYKAHLREWQHWSVVRMQPEALSYDGNYLDLDPHHRDRGGLGMPVIRVTYDLQPNEQRLADFMAGQSEAILRAMGATKTWHGPRFTGAGSSHDLGGCRMGDDPAASVVDRTLRVHDTPGLYVFSGAVFPTCPGINPTLTLWALCLKAAARADRATSVRGGAMTPSEPPVAGRVVLMSEDGVTTLTLDRPAKLNAIGPDMLADLDRRLAEIDVDPDVRVVIVTGSGERAFSVGADIDAWTALEPLDMWRSWIRDGHRVLQRLAHLRQPTIAAINGYAFGGGLELALAADIRIAADSATFALPETKIGTLPGWAGTTRLPEAIGVARAKQMIFSGCRIDAATAEHWGLVNEVVAAGTLMERCRALATEIAASAPIAVQLAKAAINGDASAPEAFAGALAAGAEDGREGVAAFREKRPPRFSGR